jgi:putative ABC transport system substrate-binding protein
MNRREFITILGGAAAAWPVAVRAQQPGMQHVAVLMGLAEDDPETKVRLARLRQELKRLGWSEGRTVRIDTRFAPSGAQAQMLAKELVALQPEVILAHSAQILAAVQRETRSIPTVFVNVSDPIGLGFIASLARSGRNITGLTHYEEGVVGKWLALLKEIAPRITRVAVMNNPKSPVHEFFMKAASAAAPSLGLEIVRAPVETAADVEGQFESFARVPGGGLCMPPDVTTITHRNLIVALAARHRLPVAYAMRQFVEAGGLMSYGTDQIDMFGQTASYIDRILRGAKPADLPVQAPTRYETVLNLKTAKALGLDVPPSLLVRADEIIE